jgi:NAD(P)-dependent dehydrogenase (short-subunit alcohol dehydrogenase family)/rhamnose utilization protein RhaD (predicted bifunctional aldolase and dehydrogenase)
MKTVALQDLSELVALSRLFGSDPEYVLGGGGNTSFKTTSHLFIKASGTSLSDIDAGGFVRLERARLQSMWQRSYPEDPQAREALVTEVLLAAREKGEEAKRPSVETPLHDFFPEAYVVHTHPSLVNGLACSRRGREEVRALFGERALWIPTVNPGFQLAATARGEMEAYRKRHGRSPDLLVLQNHGLCVAGSSLEDVRARSAAVLEAIRARVSGAPDLSPAPVDRERAQALAPALRMLLAGQEGGSLLSFQANHLLLELLASREVFAEVSTALTPDHIVYCNHLPLFIPWEDDIEKQYRLLERGLSEYKTHHGFAPKITVVERLGAFAWGTNRKSAATAMAVFLDALKVLHYSRAFGGPQPMPPEQVDFILNWEAEAHRKKVSAGAGRAGRLAERIALVTGAAQGFGLGISEGLLAEGANVILADLNGPLVREQATDLGRKHGEARVLAVEADVTDEASVRAMVEQAVLGFGGLDLFVSNAGVLRAGGLEETDLAAFELVNRVNYTAYFLGCRYASRPMKVQHRFDPQRFMDIVQINSKSGLAGSNRNFAYAGSKFGSIGLTQSFALELVEHNIKVNAVCPGNLFDGPLWSDPESGLFVQYLRAGKIPGAKTIADVRRFYEDKVPMRRGCRVQDVVRAILYLVEQVYETGQAMPVTGGQIMLK